LDSDDESKYYSKVLVSKKHLCRTCGAQFAARLDLCKHIATGEDCSIRKTRHREEQRWQEDNLKVGMLPKCYLSPNKATFVPTEEQYKEVKVVQNLPLNSVYSVDLTSPLGLF